MACSTNHKTFLKMLLLEHHSFVNYFLYIFLNAKKNLQIVKLHTQQAANQLELFLELFPSVAVSDLLLSFDIEIRQLIISFFPISYLLSMF